MSSSHDDLSGFGSISGDSPIIGSTPPPTLISQHGSNLAIDLIWDSSVAGAPNGFVSAVDSAAKLLVSLLHTASLTVLYIDVGWGEYAGQALDPAALGQSNFTPDLIQYGDLASLLTAHGDTLTASNEPTDSLFLITNAEAKALGAVSGTSGGASAPDGEIGFGTLAGTGYSWQFDASGTHATQFNLQAVALHELTEVMGRISSEGTYAFEPEPGVIVPLLAPLDLFDFSAPGTLSLSPAGGYFSTNNGVTQMGQFNDVALVYGGDVGDWASFNSVSDSQTLPPNHQDAFVTFGRPGYNLSLSLDDLLVMEALGY